jgi:5-methyltetrahydropteroyltriglutamate--homocysteine methyltransferase
VDGRNVWVNDLDQSMRLLDRMTEFLDRDRIVVSTSCSLLHVPYGLDAEPESDIKRWLSFASEKIDEVVLLGRLFHGAGEAVDGGSGEGTRKEAEAALERNRAVMRERRTSELITDPEVTKRMSARQGSREEALQGGREEAGKGAGKGTGENAREGERERTEREGDFSERNRLQREVLDLPSLPATTIGSYPQTPELRKMRRDYRKGRISKDDYEAGIREYIDRCVAFQDSAGLDVLVHGEPERNDMVEYFGQMLEGFHFTENGWVQSYGSRCVKPPVIYGDVSRPGPMTVRWITYAQGKTKKPMKGMLTGPVTITSWSFVRDDKPRSEVSRQIAFALSDEIDDLQEAGIKIIQVDEPAFKEGYPLRRELVPDYESWAVANFKLAVSRAKKRTQVHTHMCYSEFNDIIETIEAMDADVITIETARSGNELLSVFREAGYRNEIGPGVYDIHSPRVPPVDEFEEQIRSRLEVLPKEQLWVNPDCGLKTRKWDEVEQALANMVEAVRRVRTS